MKMYQQIGNIVFYTSDSMLVENGFFKQKRSWRERLFSRPWRPFQSSKKIEKYKPDPNLMVIKRDDYGRIQTMVGHPETIKLIKTHSNDGTEPPITR